VEASTIPATAVLAPPQRGRISAGPLLRLRSDEQLVRLFRGGSEEAFRTIHDRYRARLLAYARQMLGGSRQDAEDALQDVFVRAYAALRANDREVSLRAWLYRIAHNRCIDELRRPAPPSPETLELVRPPASDPFEALEQRESLRRLVEDVRRLPEQQRSALLMREISGMAYEDLAAALDVTVPAIKSLLVRARIGLAQAAEARDTACAAIREELTDAHDRGVRASGLARRHLHDCADCRAYRGELRALRARFAALVPTLGPGALVAKLLGIGGGAAGGASAAGGGAGAVAGGAAAGAAGGGALGVTASHVVAVVAVAVVGASGAVEVQHKLAHRHAHAPAIVRQAVAVTAPAVPATAAPAVTTGAPTPADAQAPIDPAADPLASDPTTTVADPPVAEEAGNGGAAPPPELAEPDPAQEPPPADAAGPDEAPPADSVPADPASTPAEPVGSSASDSGASAPEASTATTP